MTVAQAISALQALSGSATLVLKIGDAPEVKASGIVNNGDTNSAAVVCVHGNKTAAIETPIGTIRE